jgi:amino acid transporter
VIAFTGLEAAASLAAEVTASPQELRRLIGPGSFVIVLVYVGIAIVGIGALPVHHGVSALGSAHLRAPLLGLVEAYHPRWLADVLKYTVAIVAAAGLIAAAGRRCSGSRASDSCSRATIRSRARWVACTSAGARPTSWSASPRSRPRRSCCPPT